LGFFFFFLRFLLLPPALYIAGVLPPFFNSPLNRCGVQAIGSGDLLADKHINQWEVLSRIIGIHRDRYSRLGGEVLDGDASFGGVCKIIIVGSTPAMSRAVLVGGVMSHDIVLVPTKYA
jgi:hypothetical protein